MGCDMQTYDSKVFGLGGSQSNRFQPALMAGIDPKAGPEPIPGMSMDDGGPTQANGNPHKGHHQGRGASNGVPTAGRAAVGAGNSVNARMGLPPTAVGPAMGRNAVGVGVNGAGVRAGPPTSGMRSDGGGMRSDGGGMRSVSMAGPSPYAIGVPLGAQKEGRKTSRSSKAKAAGDQVCLLLPPPPPPPPGGVSSAQPPPDSHSPSKEMATVSSCSDCNSKHE